ncbi:MAG: 3-dehydroquinate synthase [Bdellovibrionales bacterium]
MFSVLSSSKLPRFSEISNLLDDSYKHFIVICDSKFKNKKILKSWFKKKGFHFYFIPSGESIKSVKFLGVHLKEILKISEKTCHTDFAFISIGGGSIGDVTGFLASVYKRGSPVMHIPTTYLAALDSAHGGKTALNFQNIKNFIGSYHFPKAVFIVKDFFKTLSKKQVQSGYGELLKMALIGGGSFYKNLKKSPQISDSMTQAAIVLKMKIVKKDPYEKKGIRKVLNLGHTIGHIFESVYGLPHGVAVLQGLLFSITWSFKKNFLNQADFDEIKSLIPVSLKKVSKNKFIKFLRKDKKYKSSHQIDFVFIKKPGKVFIKSVSEKEIIQEAQRQGIF